MSLFMNKVERQRLVTGVHQLLSLMLRRPMHLLTSTQRGRQVLLSAQMQT